MITVEIKIVPHGIKEQAQEIGYMEIWNDGTGTEDKGNYKFSLFGKNRYKMYEGEVKGFRRLKMTVWWLVYFCLYKYTKKN